MLSLPLWDPQHGRASWKFARLVGDEPVAGRTEPPRGRQRPRVLGGMLVLPTRRLQKGA